MFFKKIFRGVAGFFLLLMGFSNCGCNKPEMKYGVPFTEYKLSGYVKSAYDASPLPAIQTNLGSSVCFTDANGYFELFASEYCGSASDFTVSFRDINGNTDGDFDNKDTTFSALQGMGSGNQTLCPEHVEIRFTVFLDQK